MPLCRTTRALLPQPALAQVGQLPRQIGLVVAHTMAMHLQGMGIPVPSGVQRHRCLSMSPSCIDAYACLCSMQRAPAYMQAALTASRVTRIMS